MRAFIHAMRGAPWNEECAAALRGFQKAGIECVLFSSNEELDSRERQDVVVGGMLIMEHVLRQYDITPEIYNYPEELGAFLGREIRCIKLRDIRRETLPFFMKPVEDKAAEGRVIRTWSDLGEYERLSPDSDILRSDVVEFLSEWRCFVRYGRILGIRCYKGDRSLTCDPEAAERAVKAYAGIPAGCSLDFGVTGDGRTLLVEMNDALSLGCYGLADLDYAKLLSARWAELTGTADALRAL